MKLFSVGISFLVTENSGLADTLAAILSNNISMLNMCGLRFLKKYVSFMLDGGVMMIGFKSKNNHLGA